MESGNYLLAERKRDLYVKWMQVCASIKEGSCVLLIIGLHVACLPAFSFHLNNPVPWY